MKFEQLIRECKKNNSEYTNLGKLFYLPAFNNVLTGFYLEKVNDHFYVWIFEQPLIIPKENIIFNFGNRIKNDLTDEYLFEINEESIHALKIIFSNDQNKERIKNLNDLGNFYNHYKNYLNNFNYLRILSFVSAFLDENEAQFNLNEFIKQAKVQYENGFSNYLLIEIKRAELILTSSEDEKKTLFNEWKKNTISSLKLK